MKRYKLKKKAKITILEILCLISIIILYMFATMINDESVCAFLWVCIIFVIPGIALLFELYKEEK